MKYTKANQKKKQSIELTKKQFKALLKVVYLGNWMANAQRTDDKNEEYERIEDLIFSYAPQFGFEEYMSHEESDGGSYYPTSDFEETTDVMEMVDDYNDDTFWDELAERMGGRDFIEKYSKEEIEKMSREESFTLLSRCIDKYHEEFEKRGLERVRVEKN